MVYQVCIRCVMDTTDPDITFDEKGLCSHCSSYYKKGHVFFLNSKEKNDKLNLIIDDIRNKGYKNNYDCVIGVSGGIDSTYVAYKVKEFGLRPLAVHLDNGWNSELAVSNINNTMNKLKIDFYTHVIDWAEFRDLQLSFLKASVIDIEMLTDHALQAALFNAAAKNKIKYIIWGRNYATESIMPKSWSHWKIDLRNIKAIHKQFGTQKSKTFPMMGITKFYYNKYILRIRSVSLLDYLEYDKEVAMRLLEEELDWKRYERKHDESVFTKFYQDFILPKKFNADKRKAHLSSMINSGLIKRDEALSLLNTEDPINSPKTTEMKVYFLKKMNLTEEKWEEIINLPVKKHSEYPNDEKYWLSLNRVRNVFRAPEFVNDDI